MRLQSGDKEAFLSVERLRRLAATGGGAGSYPALSKGHRSLGCIWRRFKAAHDKSLARPAKAPNAPEVRPTLSAYGPRRCTQRRQSVNPVTARCVRTSLEYSRALAGIHGNRRRTGPKMTAPPSAYGRVYAAGAKADSRIAGPVCGGTRKARGSNGPHKPGPGVRKGTASYWPDSCQR